MHAITILRQCLNPLLTHIHAWNVSCGYGYMSMAVENLRIFGGYRG